MSTDQLSMSMFATRADYDEAVRVQHEQLPGLQLAVKLLAQIGDDDSDRAIAAVHAACDLAQRVADLESIVNAPRGTDAQIMKEREIAAAAIDGALAFGYQGTEAPEAWHWLLAAHNAGKRIAELEAERDEWRRIASAYSPQKELSTALEQAKASGRQARKERDELRAKYDPDEATSPGV